MVTFTNVRFRSKHLKIHTLEGISCGNNEVVVVHLFIRLDIV